MLNKSKKGWRNDAYSKVTGKTKYADDLKFHNMLHAVPVYSNFVHATIKSIEIKEAEESEGVIKVITAKDIPGDVCFGQIQKDYYMLVTNTIRGNGDVIAIVVADTRVNAIDASSKIKIDAEQLPLILDPEKAMLPESPLVHKGKKTNIVAHHKVRKGNVDIAFEKSEKIIEREYQTQLIEHAYMEPESAVCVPKDDGVYEIYASLQHPFTTRRFVSAILDVKLSEVDVKGISMGGGFGGKDDTASIVSARAALAAKITGKPVKITYKREWSIRESYKRHPYKLNYKVGLSKEGKIEAVECKFIADAGNYTSMTPFVLWRSIVQCCGPYKVDNVKCDAYGVHTNNVFTGAMRGFGSPQVNFAIESLVEELAKESGLSSLEFRKLNMVKQGDITVTNQKLEDHVVSLEETFDIVTKEFEYERKLKKCSFGKSDQEQLYGVGLAMSYRGMSLGAEGKDFCSAIISVQFDGSVLLEVGVHDNGQGAESAMILILADELGINRDRIRYRRLSTSSIPDGGPTVASRATLMGGGAVTIAARNLKTLICETVAKTLKCKCEDVLFDKDGIKICSTNMFIRFDEVIQLMFNQQIYPYAFGVFQAPDVSWDEEKGQGKAYFTWVYGCQAVELTVNKSNGKVKLLNAIAAHDVGKVINKEMLLGQYYGGMVMGAGLALKEKVILEDGIILNQNFNNYKIMRANDIPKMIGIFVENPDPLSPSGAKGIGEPANEIMAPAIANAIYNATGKRYYNLPIKIEMPK